jgi:hypothetical protein
MEKPRDKEESWCIRIDTNKWIGPASDEIQDS